MSLRPVRLARLHQLVQARFLSPNVEITFTLVNLQEYLQGFVEAAVRKEAEIQLGINAITPLLIR